MPEEMLADLQAAQRGEKAFDADRFAGSFTAKKHDHFLIPAGTLHCSGANATVLEISATPYIFTFKLWDWNRLGLDGKPRPVNIERGSKVILWYRDECYARSHLVNRFTPIASGPGWREERTGLHPAEFIETRRHWFTGKVEHHTGGREYGSVHVLNLVEGEEAVVESPSGAFEPFRRDLHHPSCSGRLHHSSDSFVSREGTRNHQGLRPPSRMIINPGFDLRHHRAAWFVPGDGWREERTGPARAGVH